MQDAYRKNFIEAYDKLNVAQKKAAGTTEGPVMVIAGPGTGKTQILSLRIANIINNNLAPADGILCLTFTKSGVEAMRQRLRKYIGADSSKVEINTYHSFGTKIIEEFYAHIGLQKAPTTLEDSETISLFDHILNTNDWEYLRPRGNSSMYYHDLKSLISLLRREGMSPENFLIEIEKEIATISDDPSSLSSRGETKGQIKKEIQNRLDSLARTREVVKFYELYEQEKREKNVMDYDDILSFLIKIVGESQDAVASLRERYLYVLVDEHQDSSGIQNEFLKLVWGGVEQANIFVVGDDRQLIYGFGGAKLSHFKEFVETFIGTKVITLIENYRSTQNILDVADALLSSSLSIGKLESHDAFSHPISLVETKYPRDEIINAGLLFKEKIASGVPAKECALLVPKNAQVRNAITILRDMGLPVSSNQSLRLFDIPEVGTFLKILKVVNNPYDNTSVAELVLDPISNINPILAHRFLYDTNSYKISLNSLLQNEDTSFFGKKIENIILETKEKSIYNIIQTIGSDFFTDSVSSHEVYIKRIEIIRSMLHLALTLIERNPKASLSDFLQYVSRLEEYGENIPLAIFGSNDGIQVMTLHGSKGLEFEVVWVAHIGERSLMGSNKSGFSLPESLSSKIEKKDESVAKRELYVAITRAKKFCTISYSLLSHSGSPEKIASILEALPDGTFDFRNSVKTENEILENDPLLFVNTSKTEDKPLSKKELQELVALEYSSKKVSVTLLNTFYDCPWKWYFKSFLQIPEPQSESLQFGSIVHGAIEQIIKNENTPSKNEILEAVKSAIDKCNIVDMNTISRFSKEANSAVVRFVENQLPDLWEMRESEKSFSYRDPEAPDLIITGKIDLIESDSSEALRVTDFKTGKTRTAKDVERFDDEGRLSDYMRQLAMYSYLIENNINGKNKAGNQKVELSRLCYVEEIDAKKMIYQTAINEEQISLLVKDIKDYDLSMKDGTWTERPCNWKGYGGKEKECPYCKVAEMYK